MHVLVLVPSLIKLADDREEKEKSSEKERRSFFVRAVIFILTTKPRKQKTLFPIYAPGLVNWWYDSKNMLILSCYNYQNQQINHLVTSFS
jgi:hypothetical protein